MRTYWKIRRCIQRKHLCREKVKRAKTLQLKGLAVHIDLISEDVMQFRVLGMFGYREGNEAEYVAKLKNELQDRCGDVISVDYPGHGHSNGRRGYIPDVNNLATVCFGVLRRLIRLPELFGEPKRKGKPIYIVAYSTGVVAAILCYFRYRFTTRHVKGMVLVSSPISVVQNSSRFAQKLKWLAPFLSFVFGHVRVPRIFMEKSVRKMARGGLVGFNEKCYVLRPFLRYACEMFRISFSVQILARQLRIPLCVIHGTEDKVADFQMAWETFNGMENVEFIALPGVGHYVWGEAPRDVMEHILEWIEKQTKLEQKK